MKVWTRLSLLPWVLVFVECDWMQEINVKDEVQAVVGHDVTLPCSLPIGKGKFTVKWWQIIINRLVLIDDSTGRNSPTLGDLEKGNCSHTILIDSRSLSPMTFQVEITKGWRKCYRNVTLHVAAAPRLHTEAGGSKDTTGGENSPTSGTSSPILNYVIMATGLMCVAAVA